MKLYYNSKVRTYHSSTCVEYIYFYQNCTESVVLILKSGQSEIYPGEDKCTQYMWSNYMSMLWNRISATF